MEGPDAGERREQSSHLGAPNAPASAVDETHVQDSPLATSPEVLLDDTQHVASPECVEVQLSVDRQLEWIFHARQLWMKPMH